MKLPALAGIVGLAGLSLAASLPQANDLMGRDEMASLEAANVEAAMGGVAFVPCKGVSMEDSIFQVQEINLSPNPPRKNANVTISVTGTLKEKVEKGAVMKATVKWHKRKLVELQYDFCDGASAPCPLKPGNISFQYDQWIEKRIPTALKYTILVDTYSKDNQRLSCVQVQTKVRK